MSQSDPEGTSATDIGTAGPADAPVEHGNEDAPFGSNRAARQLAALDQLCAGLAAEGSLPEVTMRDWASTRHRQLASDFR